MTDLSSSVDTIVDDIDGVVDAVWSDLGVVGTWLTGAERRLVLETARTAVHDRGPGAGPEVADADDRPTVLRSVANQVAHAASSITADRVDEVESAGLTRETYVEVVGVVSRLMAIDTYDRGRGRSPRPLPPAGPGTPPATVVGEARRRAGWVPTVGPIGPTTALDAVPAEAAAQRALHGALYLDYDDMGDLSIVRQLTRAQMELVAARVSYLNECHF